MFPRSVARRTRARSLTSAGLSLVATTVAAALVVPTAGAWAAEPSPTTSSGTASGGSASSTNPAPQPSGSTTAPAPSPTTPSPTTTKPPKPTPTPTPTATTPPKPARPVTEVSVRMVNFAGSSKYAGVAELIRLEFGTKVRKKAVVEKALKVTSTSKIPVGSWAWLSDSLVVYRPKKWWPGHAKITVSLPAPGTVIGRLRDRNLVIDSDTPRAVSFRTGRSLVATVDANTHRMKVVIDGKVAKDFPVSLGKSGWESRSGIKVYYGSREATHTYTSDSLGLTDETYELVAPWNTRLTPTGEFIHTAQWAYGRIGRYNGSHGCTNMFESDAKWIYDNVRVGDPFVYKGTSKQMESWNGPYALWNISWSEWRAKSSLVQSR